MAIVIIDNHHEHIKILGEFLYSKYEEFKNTCRDIAQVEDLPNIGELDIVGYECEDYALGSGSESYRIYKSRFIDGQYKLFESQRNKIDRNTLLHALNGDDLCLMDLYLTNKEEIENRVSNSDINNVTGYELFKCIQGYMEKNVAEKGRSNFRMAIMSKITFSASSLAVPIIRKPIKGESQEERLVNDNKASFQYAADLPKKLHTKKEGDGFVNIVFYTYFKKA